MAVSQSPAATLSIFAERFRGVVAPHAQHTQRLSVVVHLVGHALGDAPGNACWTGSGWTMGADTIVRVRQTRRTAPPDCRRGPARRGHR